MGFVIMWGNLDVSDVADVENAVELAGCGLVKCRPDSSAMCRRQGRS
jgi:hypothetical protein